MIRYKLCQGKFRLNFKKRFLTERLVSKNQPGKVVSAPQLDSPAVTVLCFEPSHTTTVRY